MLKTTLNVKKNDIDNNCCFDIPKEVSENLASYDISMPGIDNEIDNYGDDEGGEKVIEKEKEASYIYCVPCYNRGEVARKKSSCCSLIKVKDMSYSCSDKEKQERWFLNFKKSIKIHLTRLQHYQRCAIFYMLQADKLKKSKKIEETRTNILYYILKTNTAWALYPVLLAVLHRSGQEIGNINHSIYGCEQMCKFVNNELISESRQWFQSQSSVTVIADVGTILVCLLFYLRVILIRVLS